MNYFEVPDKEYQGDYIIYPFAKVALIYKHFQENQEPHISVGMDNNDIFEINETTYHKYMEWLKNE